MSHACAAFPAGVASGPQLCQSRGQKEVHILAFCQIWQPQHEAQEEWRAGKLKQRCGTTAPAVSLQAPAPNIPSHLWTPPDLRGPLFCSPDMTPHQEPLEPVATGQGLRERGGRAQEGQSWSRPPAPEIWNVWSVFSPTFGLAKTSSRRLRGQSALALPWAVWVSAHVLCDGRRSF